MCVFECVRVVNREREGEKWRAVEPLDPVNCSLAINKSSKQVTQCCEEFSECPSLKEGRKEKKREKLK